MNTLVDTARGFIEVGGEDRVAFLQGIVTQDVELLKTSPLLFAAILTPQGKLAHDFFLFAHKDAILLDTPAQHTEVLIKRLTMYKLRARVTLRDVSGAWKVAYVHEGGLPDPRHPQLPQRSYSLLTQPSPRQGEGASGARSEGVSVVEYHQRRLALGIPESPFDTTADDVAMDLGYDLLNAISFTKGCFVGQEVTARMHHKQVARRGFYLVESTAPLPASGTEIKAGETKVGTLRGTQGMKGLALLKFEEVEAAIDRNTALTVDSRPLQVSAPAWIAPKLALFHAARENQ